MTSVIRVRRRHAHLHASVFGVIALTLIGCHETPRSVVDTTTRGARVAPVARVAESRTTDSGRKAAPDTITVATPDIEPAGAPTDSTLPRWSFTQVPGWLVIGDADPSTAPDTALDHGTGATEVADSVFGIFPYDSTWARVDRRRSLTLLLRDAKTTVFAYRSALKDDHWDLGYVAFRPSHHVNMARHVAAWLLPTDMAADAIALAVHDSLSPDGNVRIWSAGTARVILRRRDSISARMTAEQSGVRSTDMGLFNVDAGEDKNWGVDSPTTLSLVDERRIPVFPAAFRLGKEGPIVFVYVRHGYECINYHVVLFLAARIADLEKPWYYACAT